MIEQDDEDQSAPTREAYRANRTIFKWVDEGKQVFRTPDTVNINVELVSRISIATLQVYPYGECNGYIKISSVGQNYGRLAQMVERSLSMREAPGSIPGLSIASLAQLVRACPS